MSHLSTERAIKLALIACFLVLYLSPAFAQIAVSPAKVTCWSAIRSLSALSTAEVAS
jgi:hypothetical protein